MKSELHDVYGARVGLDADGIIALWLIKWNTYYNIYLHKFHAFKRHVS